MHLCKHRAWKRSPAFKLHTFALLSADYKTTAELSQVIGMKNTSRCIFWRILIFISVIKILQEHGGYVLSITMTCDDSKIVSCLSDKNVKVWNINTRIYLYTLHGHTDEICYLTIPHGNTNAKFGWCKSINIWDIHSLANVQVLLKMCQDWIHSLVINCHTENASKLRRIMTKIEVTFSLRAYNVCPICKL